jgi:geranylgeranyl diphosphate synthase, type II
VKEYQHLLDLFTARLAEHRKSIAALEPRELYEPEDYILSLGGKRIRPLLALIACDLFGKDPQLSMSSALAVEVFHNFSLIHDDILDAAPIRRNQPTVHTKWNTNIAILSGDVMLVKAFQCLKEEDDRKFKKLSLLLFETAIRVCEGQQADMNFESKEDVTVNDYIEMISAKTAVLLGCSLQMGAICADASTESQESIYRFGKHLGIAFQLLDDLLDTFSENPSGFGKQVGGDILANKKTFLLLKALELGNKEERSALKELCSGKHDNAEKKIRSVTGIFEKLGVADHCRQTADKHTRMALEELEKISCDTGKKSALKNFAQQLLSRSV